MAKIYWMLSYGWTQAHGVYVAESSRNFPLHNYIHWNRDIFGAHTPALLLKAERQNATKFPIWKWARQ
jgi:hypothetical protein